MCVRARTCVCVCVCVSVCVCVCVCGASTHVKTTSLITSIRQVTRRCVVMKLSEHSDIQQPHDNHMIIT